MAEISSFSRLRLLLNEWLRFSAVPAFIAALTLATQAHAQESYAFRDDAQIAEAMLELAARTTTLATLPDGCQLHIVTVAGGGDFFTRKTFHAMNQLLARGVDPRGSCKAEMHEMGRDEADALFTRLKSQGSEVFMLDITYIPLSKHVVAYTKLRDQTGRLIGESGRYDLPVTKSVHPVETVASTRVAANVIPKAAPKVTTKLLTEVHFDPGSANVTVVGRRKIDQAIEAIKKQNPREIRILGFTDSTGTEVTNKAVAGARAANVARLLKEHGINVPLVIEGRGETGGPHTIPDNNSEPLNRCVGIIAVDVPVGP
jgi:outer membrane protein OmpA-like peptidoglycan-associated protein